MSDYTIFFIGFIIIYILVKDTDFINHWKSRSFEDSSPIVIQNLFPTQIKQIRTDKDNKIILSDEQIKCCISELEKKAIKSLKLPNSQIDLRKRLVDKKEYTPLEIMQKFANEICAHLFITARFTIKIVEKLDEGVAGKYSQGQGSPVIEIPNPMEYSIEQIFAILSHEITHYFLIKKRKIIFKNNQENEIFTEISSVYLGFGFLILEGYLPRIGFTSKFVTEQSVGYFSTDTVKRAILLTAKIRKQNKQEILDYFSNDEDKKLALIILNSG